jgi:alkanesulfonate monooxygenase
MPIEIVGGMISPYEGAEGGNGALTAARGASRRPFDTEYITRFVRAHEASGFDTALVGYGATGVDGFSIASHALHVTEKLGVLIAHRPGFAQPTLVARKLATLDNLTGGGRVAMHFITGGDETDQHRDGDFVPHDDRYRRTAEYMEVLRRTLTADEPFDHEGEFYKFEGAYSVVKPATEAGIPLYFGGASGPALEAGAKNADTYMLWGEPLAGIAERIAQVREVSAKYGRSPRFSISLRPILGATEDEAWARAQEIGDRTEERVKGRDFAGPGARRNASSVGAARLRAFAAEGDVLDERLWMRVARLTGSGGNSTALVGTPEQVADALLKYIRLGLSTVLIRGFDPLGDAIDYGKELIPRLREATKDLEPRKELAFP